MRRALLVVGVIVSTSAPAFTQSLADVAKKTAEARAAKNAATEKKTDTTAAPKTAFTDKDLENAPTSTVPAGSPTPADQPVIPPIPPSLEQERQAEYKEVALKDEAYWKRRMQNLQTALDADTIHLAAMESRVKSLSADFDNSLSISQRAVLRREYEDAITEVTRLKASVMIDRRAVGTCEEEARRAGVPPGWLRP